MRLYQHTTSGELYAYDAEIIDPATGEPWLYTEWTEVIPVLDADGLQVLDPDTGTPVTREETKRNTSAEMGALCDRIRATMTPRTDAEAQAIRDAQAAQNAPSRASIIRARLAQIDADSIRPARAVAAALAAGQPVPDFDGRKLADLETEAAALRAELASL